MIFKLFITFLLMQPYNLWSIGTLCPTETQHRFINWQHWLLQLTCNVFGNYSQINEVLDFNELTLNQEELDLYFGLKVTVKKKILTKVISKYDETISQINIPLYLREIILFDNKIDRIENDFFSGLIYLSILSLNQNGLREIEPYSFKDLESLKLLELMSNKLTLIRNNTFSGLGNSDGKVILESNDISYLEIDAFKGLGFHEINLNNNNLKSIRKGIFSQTSNLRILYLESNQIIEIESNSFLENEMLTHVFLRSNKIKIIHSNVFNKNLIYLTLNGNFLSNLNSETFADVSSLIELVITNIKLQLVEFKSDKFKNLEKLDISNNYVIRITQNSFSDMSILKSLNLSHNYLDALEENRFHGLISLEKLDLSFNEIKILTEKFLSGLYFLNELHLENNKMKVIELNAFRDLTKLTSIYLSCNSLTNLAYTTFSSQASLNILVLNQNGLESIDFLDTLQSLKTLDLSNNLVKKVREKDFQTTSKTLELLDLNMNQISYLESSLFGKLPLLKTLRISRTYLDYINLTEIFIQMPDQLNELDIGHNSVHLDQQICSSSLQKIKKIYLQNVTFFNSNGSSFEAFVHPTLEFLDVSHNDFSGNNTSVFTLLYTKRSNSLHKLLINNCNLQTMSDLNFPYGGPYLYEFSFNNLSTIDQFWSKGGWVDHRVDFSHNQISHIIYDPSSNIEPFSIYSVYINLEHNKLTKLDAIMFQYCGSISILKLSYNYLIQIPLIESEGIKELYLDHNNLTNLKIFNSKNEQIEFLKFRNNLLAILTLDFNQIESIENKTFQHLRKLETLSMSNNYFSRINRIDFFYQYQLKFLNLSHNRIQVIEYDSFINLNNLLSLDLSFNELISIENGQFKGLNYLTSLHLNNNHELKQLKSLSFEYLINIRNMRLNELLITEDQCMLIKFKNEFKAERSVENRYLFYRSLNLISPNFNYEKNQTFLCDLTFKLLQFRIHFNLKSDYENELFYEKCKYFIIKKSNRFSKSKKDCFNGSSEISFDDMNINNSDKNIIEKVMSNLYYLGTMFALLLLLMPGFIYVCLDICGRREHKALPLKQQKKI
jgi:Leucine-rich repeat (LRR) protein